MAAGVAAMKELTPDVYEDLNRKGARVKDQLTEVFASHGLAAQVNSAASLLAIHFTDVPVVDYRTKATSNPKITHDFFLALVNHGVLMAPRAMAPCPPRWASRTSRNSWMRWTLSSKSSCRGGGRTGRWQANKS